MGMQLYEELGDKLLELSRVQGEWSQAIFGKDTERGPIGPLQHLAKEAVEAEEAWKAISLQDALNSERYKKFRAEMADCLILLLDASRRGDIKPLQLIEDALKKMEVNKLRKWPEPQPDKPVEHIREDGK